MRFYAPIAKVEAEERMVWGYASTAAEDDQGETITRDALAEALGEYLKFANIREMHQMSAVGIAEEAAVDDRGLYVAARIVDSRAWDKVRSGVYKGFSIGGRVRSRDPADRKTITALTLSEISLVDRPANPEAVFDCWKADGAGPMAGRPDDDQAALDHVHDCLRALTDGDCCTAVKATEHRAKTMLGPLKAAHDAVCRAGAQCDGFVADDGADKAARADDLMKAFTSEIMPRLDALAKRVEQIAAVPLPPLTMARAAVAYVNLLPTGTAGTGTALTSSGAGSIVEIDTMFQTMWNTYQLSPTVLYVNVQELKNITAKVLSNASAPLLRYEVGEGNAYDFGAAGVISFYFNPYALNGGLRIPIRIHPKVPPGTIIGWAENLPVQYQSNEVPNVAEVKTRQDYYQIDWPVVTRQRQVGVYAEEVLAVYAPFAMGVIGNIANG